MAKRPPVGRFSISPGPIDLGSGVSITPSISGTIPASGPPTITSWGLKIEISFGGGGSTSAPEPPQIPDGSVVPPPPQGETDDSDSPPPPQPPAPPEPPPPPPPAPPPPPPAPPPAPPPPPPAPPPAPPAPPPPDDDGGDDGGEALHTKARSAATSPAGPQFVTIPNKQLANSPTGTYLSGTMQVATGANGKPVITQWNVVLNFSFPGGGSAQIPQPPPIN